jgi:hypothetical protein
MDELKGKLADGCGEGASPGWCECDTASGDVKRRLGETGNPIDCGRNLASERVGGLLGRRDEACCWSIVEKGIDGGVESRA